MQQFVTWWYLLKMEQAKTKVNIIPGIVWMELSEILWERSSKVSKPWAMRTNSVFVWNILSDGIRRMYKVNMIHWAIVKDWEIFCFSVQCSNFGLYTERLTKKNQSQQRWSIYYLCVPMGHLRMSECKGVSDVTQWQKVAVRKGSVHITSQVSIMIVLLEACSTFDFPKMGNQFHSAA